MFIAMTGLHGAGKSYLVEHISKNFDFYVYNKKEIVRNLCEKATGNGEIWNKWYNDEYNKDPILMTNRILNELPLGENIILDAVHSNLEWEIIKSVIPNASLAIVVTPYEIRKERKGTYDIDKGDSSRIGFWHNNKAESNCLLTSASWTFNGASSIETNLQSFEEFINYLKQESQENIEEITSVNKSEKTKKKQRKNKR